MSSETVFTKISAAGIVPVIAIDSVDQALPLADALLEGGLPVIEVTFRTAAAGDVIALLSEERPGLLVGAGTVLTEKNLRAAKYHGACFAVSPGLNPDIVRGAAEIGLPFAPGVATPSDIEGALSLGCTLLKFFPAGMLGGVAMVRALSGPYTHMGLRFMPTGGVNIDNLADYLSCETVAAVGGTWLAKKEDLAAGRWDTIRDRCRAAVEMVARIRASEP
jgi:2-dehydro-3-deoxyphosphogluconate aldolase/(4S)-4-hydroxy-2-oxoglutarate aldolase